MRRAGLAAAGCVACLGVFAADSWAGAAAGSVQNKTLRMPRGRATDTFSVSALGHRTYNVTVTATAASTISLTMEGAGFRWTLNTRDGQDCRTRAGRAVCALRFAAGGNPGGIWTAIVRKTSVPAVSVRISVVFNRCEGEYRAAGACGSAAG
jgi:hypothetical protein